MAATKINLSMILGSVMTQIQNTEAAQVKALLGDLADVPDSIFSGVLNAEGDGLAALEEFAKMLGVTYTGQSLSFWENADGVGCRPPSVSSNGTCPVIEWGGGSATLSGKISGKIMSGDVRLASDTATLRVGLRLNPDLKAEQVEDVLADAENWEDLLPVLRAFAPFKPGKELYSGKYPQITIVDFSLVENEKGSYISVLGESNGETFRFAMPQEAFLDEGGIVEVDADKHCLRYNGVEYSGGGFFKMGELELNRPYRAIEIKESGGEYGGFYLVVPGLGNVNINSQMQRWLDVVKPEVSTANPLQFVVTNIKTTKDGKKQAKLAISQPNNPGSGLAGLIGKAPTAAPKAFTPAPVAVAPASADADDWIS